MTPGEARRVLEAAHVPLESEAIERAHARTEGWPAGLYLASRAIASADSPSRALRETGGDDGDVVAYFSSEVLSQLSADQLGFVLQTSILDRFCPSLCDALLQRHDSAAMIATLQQTCGFIVGTDRRQTWFRYHLLFGETLRFILTQTNEAWLPELHARASRWHAAHDLPEEAIEHALSSGNRRRASRLFAAHVRRLFNGGGHALLRRWIQMFSDADLAEYPPAAAAAAWVLGQFGERAPTRRFISILEHANSEGPFAFGERSNASAVALLKGAFGWEGIAQMRAQADTAYRIEPAGTEAHERAALYVGANLFLRGRFDAAQRFLEEATAAAETDANTAGARPPGGAAARRSASGPARGLRAHACAAAAGIYHQCGTVRDVCLPGPGARRPGRCARLPRASRFPRAHGRRGAVVVNPPRHVGGSDCHPVARPAARGVVARAGAAGARPVS
jgi:LuxR family maltose regulon positive regulatory protein